MPWFWTLWTNSNNALIFNPPKVLPTLLAFTLWVFLLLKIDMIFVLTVQPLCLQSQYCAHSLWDVAVGWFDRWKPVQWLSQLGWVLETTRFIFVSPLSDWISATSLATSLHVSTSRLPADHFHRYNFLKMTKFLQFFTQKINICQSLYFGNQFNYPQLPKCPHFSSLLEIAVKSGCTKIESWPFSGPRLLKMEGFCQFPLKYWAFWCFLNTFNIQLPSTAIIFALKCDWYFCELLISVQLVHLHFVLSRAHKWGRWWIRGQQRSVYTKWRKKNHLWRWWQWGRGVGRSGQRGEIQSLLSARKARGFEGEEKLEGEGGGGESRMLLL